MQNRITVGLSAAGCVSSAARLSLSAQRASRKRSLPLSGGSRGSLRRDTRLGSDRFPARASHQRFLASRGARGAVVCPAMPAALSCYQGRLRQLCPAMLTGPDPWYLCLTAVCAVWGVTVSNDFRTPPLHGTTRLQISCPVKCTVNFHKHFSCFQDFLAPNSKHLLLVAQDYLAVSTFRWSLKLQFLLHLGLKTSKTHQYRWYVRLRCIRVTLCPTLTYLLLSSLFSLHNLIPKTWLSHHTPAGPKYCCCCNSL